MEQLARLRENPQNVGFSDLRRICNHFFGEPRHAGSHLVYRMPWPGDPRVNIQSDRGKAKAYQVRQVLNAVDRLLKEKGVMDDA